MAGMKSFAGSSLYRVLTLAAQFGVTVLVTRLTGAAGLGLYALIVVNAGLLHLFTSLGIPSGITHHAAAGLSGTSGLQRVILVSTVAQILVVFLVEAISMVWKGHGFLWPAPGLLPLVMGILFFLSVSLNEKYAALLTGQHRQTLVNRTAFLFTVASGITLMACMIFLGTVDNTFVISVLFLFALAQSVYLIIPSSKPSSIERNTVNAGGLNWKALLNYSLVNYLANAVQFLAYRVDYWILDHYHGREVLGIYALAVRMAQMLWVLPAVAASILFPMGSAGQADPKLVGRVVRAVFVTGIIAAVVMALLAGWLLPAVFGEAFAASVKPFWFLLPGVLLFTVNMILAAWFAGTGRPRYNMWVSIVSFMIIVILDLLWIPGHGAVGAAAASTVAYASSSIMALWLFHRDDQKGPLRIWPTRDDLRSLLTIIKRTDNP